jgi:BlaI family penicillinase repressor
VSLAIDKKGNVDASSWEDIRVSTPVVAPMRADNQRGEPAGIGELEAAVLSLVKRLGKGSVSQLLELAKGERRIAYTTLSTTLDRLYRKGLLTREKAKGKGGQHYIYSSPQSTAVQREIVATTVDRLVSAFGRAAVSNIYERLEQLSPEELKEMERMIQRKREVK